MPNVTISLNENLLRESRKFAENQGTSLNSLIRKLLKQNIQHESKWSIDEFFRIIDSVKGDSKGWKWNRDEIYEERFH